MFVAIVMSWPSSLERGGNRMASSDADPMTLVASLTRRNVRTALAFPLFELVAIALLARALHTPRNVVAIVAFL